MLTDAYLRKHNYLRISITDKCNLRCRYCMPPEGVELLEHDQVLRNEEFIQLARLFVEMGINKIRFTGGEPLIRRGFIDIVAGVRELFPEIELCLTTNGVLLDSYIEDLCRLKVQKINISLDSLLRDRYTTITGSDYLDRVLQNIDRILEKDCFHLKINAVLFEETLKELDSFFDYFKDKKISLRFIERMPFTEEDSSQSFLPANRLVEAIESMGKLVRNEKTDSQVARMYDFMYRDRFPMKTGIIPPISHKFCASCNRLRLTSDGLLKTCLHSPVEYNLLEPLRAQKNNNADINNSIKEIIHKALNLKHEGHDLDCYSREGGCASISKTGAMSKIGG
ncbi:MAG: GTP 3',8-cyclase MoaA [bacterium]|nr:GTP 3',8-cyclase MoaA [bacterium]